MPKIAIYTSIIGNYDIPTDNFEHKDGYDYFLFSDTPIITKSWKNLVVTFNVNTLSNAKKQRYIKTHPHKLLSNYDIAVYIDGNTDIDERLYRYIEENQDNIITFKKHPNRDCIYDEIKEVILVGKEKIDIGKEIYGNYQKEGFPAHYGLYENNIIISHQNDERVKELFEKWWGEIYRNSHRDQLSLNYVIWKNNLSDFISETDSKDFKPKFHIRRT